MKPAIAPVQLGCCPEAERCLLCNPSPEPPTPEFIEGLIAHYGQDDREVEVRFFGGPCPTDAMLEALGQTPFSVRVRPDLFSRADAARLVGAGCRGVELDALGFDDMALRGVRRHHRRSVVLEQLQHLGASEQRVGLVLAPGLPGTSVATCLSDARIAAEYADTVRLHPVLILDRCGLREAHTEGRYRPLTVGDCVTVCREMMDILDRAEVAVIRVGQQPGPDELGRAVAGPRHSSLRELIEATRALSALQDLLDAVPTGARVAIRCAPADVARVRGPLNQHMRTLRADHALDEVEVRPDPALPRGRYEVEVA